MDETDVTYVDDERVDNHDYDDNTDDDHDNNNDSYGHNNDDNNNQYQLYFDFSFVRRYIRTMRISVFSVRKTGFGQNQVPSTVKQVPRKQGKKTTKLGFPSYKSM